jgi:hypothetical protein
MSTDEGASRPAPDPSPNPAANLEESAKSALEFVVELLGRQSSARLNDLQQVVFIKIWQGKPYKQIHRELRDNAWEYSPEYISQDVGPTLCQILSRTLGEKITKKNFRSPILSAQSRAKSFIPYPSAEVEPLYPGTSPMVPVHPGTDRNSHQHPGVGAELAHPAQQEPHAERPFFVDWANAPDEPLFCGRSDDLADLSQRISMDSCRLVIIHGLIGIGKTALAVQLAQQVKSDFDVIVWRSLQDSRPPSLDALLTDLWQTLLGFQSLPPEPTVDLNRLLRYFNDHRCLILLDGLDIVYREGVHDGTYRAGYEAIGDFLERIATRPHQSCLVLTSQNKPKEMAAMAAPQVHSHWLTGLREIAGRDMLIARGIVAPPDYDFRSLIQRFAGHPKALRQFAATAKELCHGDLIPFLEQLGEDFPVYEYIRGQLDHTFASLSELERRMIEDLAVINEPATLPDIVNEIIRTRSLNLSTIQISDILRSLLRRALVELTHSRYSIPPIVTEYTMARQQSHTG